MFSGVWMALIMAGVRNSPATVSTIERMRPDRSVVDTAVLSFPNCFAPKSWEMTTAQPILLPTATAMKIIVIG